ncbi:MAG: hypothetical protein IPJ58_19165 [Ardenticatenia bacterium]|nr:hypothetical protein [Ardenticatenia bacterium]
MTQEPCVPTGHWKVLLAGMLFVGLNLWSYQHCLSAEFTWIDRGEILAGRMVATSMSEIAEFFVDDRNYIGYYRPVSNLLHTLNYTLFGPNAAGHHGMVLVWHVAAALLLAAILSRLFSPAAGIAIALVWSVHPVHAGSVCLISTIQGVAVLVMGLLAVWCTLLLIDNRWTTAGTLAAVLVVGVLFALSLLTKEVAVVLPLIILTMVIARRPVRPGVTARLFTVLGTITVLFVLLRLMRGPGFGTQYPMSLSERLLTFADTYRAYIDYLLVLQPATIIDTATRFGFLSSAQKSTMMLYIMAMIVAVVATWRFDRRVSVWLMLFNICLIPVSQVIPTLHARADRYLYVPSIFFLGAILFAAKCFADSATNWVGARPPGSIIYVVVGSALVLFEVTLTRTRTELFINDLVLFGAAVQVEPDYREGWCALGAWYGRAGDFERATAHYERCLSESKGKISYANTDIAIVNLIDAHIRQRQFEKALIVAEAYEASIISSNYLDEVEFNRAIAEIGLGKADAARVRLRRYVQRHPEDQTASRLLMMISGG